VNFRETETSPPKRSVFISPIRAPWRVNWGSGRSPVPSICEFISPDWIDLYFKVPDDPREVLPLRKLVMEGILPAASRRSPRLKKRKRKKTFTVWATSIKFQPPKRDGETYGLR
jgi:hypothetical protein